MLMEEVRREGENEEEREKRERERETMTMKGANRNSLLDTS